MSVFERDRSSPQSCFYHWNDLLSPVTSSCLKSLSLSQDLALTLPLTLFYCVAVHHWGRCSTTTHFWIAGIYICYCHHWKRGVTRENACSSPLHISWHLTYSFLAAVNSLNTRICLFILGQSCLILLF